MKTKRIFSILAAVVFLLLLLIGGLSSFITDYWWFDSLGFSTVFTKTYAAEYSLWLGGFLISLLVLNLNLSISLKSQSTLTLDPRIEQFIRQFGRFIRVIAYGGAVFFSFIMAGVLSANWMEMLAFFNGQAFNVADPVFGHDVGFYMFTLPFIGVVRGWLLGLFVLSIFATAVVYLIRQGISFAAGRVSVSASAQKHLSILVGLLFLLIASGYWLQRFDLLYSTRSNSFYGAGYTDIHAQLPALWIMVVVSILTGLLIVRFVLARQYKLLVKALIGFVAASILVGGVYPSLVQKFSVNPNEQSKELPYIERNIAFTRMAYDLSRIEEKTIAPESNLGFTDIMADSATIENIMLWDYRPLGSTLDQLQVFRLYYTFPDVDIDRYRLSDGSYRQVMLSARELDQRKLPKNAQTWVNTNLVYTHGYGLGMSPVNVVTEEGLPEFFVKDIPPTSDVGIEVTRPEIYFGEMTRTPVIVNGNIEEFDYPEGDANQMTKYQEDAGVSIGSLFRRLLFAIHFADLNMLISGYIAPESRILYYRNIDERVRKVAPFLSYDEDPYMVVADGRLFWIYDAYTSSSRFPYSKPVADFNYIRNPVKIVVDAYNGSMKFYEFNAASDPIIQVYRSIFPKLFLSEDQIPASLRDHLRYPQDLFDYQSWVYATYHMDDPQVFYNKEDLWNIANEKLQQAVVEMESYYVIMRLPGESEAEFIQMIPYTPNKRDNMIAWLCARSDGENYGKMLVYKFPKQELTYGPMQISARIDQNPLISQQLTLWNQQGSSVTRGNLLVIPIKKEVLYVQAVYLQATSGKLPELKRVIVSYGNSIAMEKTLDEALAAVFDFDAAVETAGGDAAKKEVASAESKVPKSVQQLSRSALQRFNRAQQFLKDGEWAKYGKEIEKLKKDLERVVDAAGQ